jgi:NADH-quinone oxidoreductase subunit L
MTFPLIVLAVLSFAGGFIGLPEMVHAPHLLSEFLEPVTSYADAYSHGHVTHLFEYIMLGGTVVILSVIIFYTHQRYVNGKHVPAADSDVEGIEKVLSAKFYIDEFYNSVITKPINVLSKFSYEWIEKGFIDRMVNSMGDVTRGSSSLLKYVQSGMTSFYMLVMVLAIIVIIFFKLVI